MSELLNENGRIGFLTEREKLLIKKWKDSGLLDELEGEWQKPNLAMLLEAAPRQKILDENDHRKAIRELIPVASCDFPLSPSLSIQLACDFLGNNLYEIDENRIMF